MSETQWNTRYLAYCRATGGLTPDETLERDRARWPGGPMCGAILWVQERWTEWERMNGRPPWGAKNPADHADFDRWLCERFPAHVEQTTLRLEAA